MKTATTPAAADVLTGSRPWSIDQADRLDFLRALPLDSVDLVFGSPPYEAARTYGIDFKLRGDAWVSWMLETYQWAARACKGVVAFVVEGQTKSYRWSATPALLMARLHEAGLHLRKPPVFHRIGIPGSGGPDWLRNDYEFIVCVTRGEKLPWSDNTAMGHPPKWAPGGAMSSRLVNGERVNGRRITRGHANGDTPNSDSYLPPVKANPGNVIHCKVGGGLMGHVLAHENEAPFPLTLAEWFVRSFCPPGGIVCDPFSGSGTTGHAAIAAGRRFVGCDVRETQVQLTRQRLESIAVVTETTP